MVLKRCASRPRPPLSAADRDRAALIERARCTTFCLRRVPGSEDDQACYGLWVQETIIRHGYRGAWLPGAVDNWMDSIGALHLANQILRHMQQLGLMSEAARLKMTNIFAMEVICSCTSHFRMTALQVLMWLHRDISGFELVRESAAAAE
jgi:hypothetical protein